MNIVSFSHSSVAMVTASKDFGQKSTKNSLKLSFFVLLVLSKVPLFVLKIHCLLKKRTLINKIKCFYLPLWTVVVASVTMEGGRGKQIRKNVTAQNLNIIKILKIYKENRSPFYILKIIINSIRII